MDCSGCETNENTAPTFNSLSKFGDEERAEKNRSPLHGKHSHRKLVALLAVLPLSAHSTSRYGTDKKCSSLNTFALMFVSAESRNVVAVLPEQKTTRNAQVRNGSYAQATPRNYFV